MKKNPYPAMKLSLYLLHGNANINKYIFKIMLNIDTFTYFGDVLNKIQRKTGKSETSAVSDLGQIDLVR